MVKIASPKQQAIYDKIKNGRDHVAIQATAGAGKSTTLLECLKLVPRLKRTVFLSFSKAIVNELKDRVPPHIKSATLHSLGYMFLTNRFKNLGNVNENKYFQFALDHFPEKNKEVYKKCFGIQQLCTYARLTLSDFSEDDLKSIADKYTIDVNPEQILISSIILEDHANLKNVRSADWTDMIYYPAVYPELITDQYDYVFWDEAQDAGKCQMALIKNIVRKPSGRLIFCGDEKQAIFGFIGSDVDSFNQIEKMFGSERMSLTVTYRCAKKIVELAQTLYPDVIEAHPDAKEGIVRRGEVIEAEEGDMIICRNTKPLIACFFELIKKNKKAFVVGKDFEKGLQAFAETVAAYDKGRTADNIEEKLTILLEELISDHVSSPESNPKYIALCEKADILLLILEKCRNGMELVGKISEIFHEDKKAIRLLTAHRSKGLECKRVFFIENFNGDKLLPSKYALLDWQKQQEDNLLFVVYTRAKEEFVFCDFNNK